MPRIPGSVVPIVFFASIAAGEAAPAGAEDGFDLGLRANVLGGTGEPTNDVLGYGLFGHAPLGDRWRIGFALDHSPEFDVEHAAKLVGLEQDPAQEEIDQIGVSTTVSAWIERVYGDRLQWLWGVGAGVSDVDIDPLAGRRSDGVQFLIETDAGTEFLLLANVGLEYRLAGRWKFSTVLSGEQRFASWEMVDVVSGRSRKVDDYLLKGIRLGFSRRF